MREEEAVLRLAETLLPGGAGFPAFGATGGGVLLLQRLGVEDRVRLLAVVTAWLGDGAVGWVEAAGGIEVEEPELFAEIRKQAYLAYYEQPTVVAAIRALGHPYHDAPLPEGYPAEAFDPVRDAPRHGRGRWVDTDEVCPVDLGGWAWLGYDENA